MPDGTWTPGGPALYAARAARALGADVTLLTNLPDGFDRRPFAGIDLRARSAAEVPRYENTYDSRGHRTQQLHHKGEPLRLSHRDLRDAGAVVLAPAFHELDGLAPVAAPVRAVLLQGILRAVSRGRVVHRPDPWDACAPFVSPGSFLFLSEEDTSQPEDLCRSAAAAGATVCLTRGADGATLFHDGRRLDRPAIEAAPVDPTGAGDAFAAAFVVRYLETGSITEAMAFALAAGALAVEGEGVAGMPLRADVEARLAKVAA
jgi:sugar/nucleoside kinase (ribokinase family)